MHREVQGVGACLTSARSPYDAQRRSTQVIITVPPVLLLFTNHPIVDRYDLSSLRLLGIGAAPVSPEMIAACKQRFAKRGWSVNIGQGYGLTETCAFVLLPPSPCPTARLD